MFRNALCQTLAFVFLVTIAAAVRSRPGDGTSGTISLRAEGVRTEPFTIDEIKTLGTAINGNVFEVGNRNTAGKYESYKYEAFHSDGCSIRWRETHEVYEGQRRTLLEVQDVTAPLLLIRLASIQTNKIGSSGHLVSFQTQKLKPGITSRNHTVYEDGSENESNSIPTGSGFYFSDGLVAQRVAKALVSSVRSCARTKGA
jgi:hypothetical protein